MLRLTEENLKEGDLEDFQEKLFEDFECSSYKGTIFVIRSNFGKEFAFFKPNKIEEAYDWLKTKV